MTPEIRKALEQARDALAVNSSHPDYQRRAWELRQEAMASVDAALAVPDAEPVSQKESLKTAHKLGFLRAAGWAQRDDLFADVDSLAYKKDRDHDLTPVINAPTVLDAMPVAWDIIEQFGRGVTDMFEQMERGNWMDDNSHKVCMNKKMLDLMPIVQAAIDFRAAHQQPTIALDAQHKAYLHPKQKPWQSLDTTDFAEIIKEHGVSGDLGYVTAIEAKLKEKNIG